MSDDFDHVFDEVTRILQSEPAATTEVWDEWKEQARHDWVEEQGIEFAEQTLERYRDKGKFRVDCIFYQRLTHNTQPSWPSINIWSVVIIDDEAKPVRVVVETHTTFDEELV